MLAIEANPDLVQLATRTFAAAIADGRLQILGSGIAAAAGEAEVHVSASKSVWSSFDRDNAARGGAGYRTVRVPCLPFADVVAAAARHLARGGCLRVAIPSESTPLWTLGWKLTTGLEFRLKYGLDYGVIMRHEHINTAREIEAVLRCHFEAVTCRVFGLSRWLSLYQFFECR